MLLLGIETSCDDTSAAVVADGRRVLSNVVTNQDAFHARFGGIVPEIASRQHLALITAAVDDALSRAGVGLSDLDGIAVTKGPGLIGSLVVGVATAKAIAYARKLPLYGVNHLHGHLFAPFLDTDIEPQYPLLAVIVSGGHSQLVHVGSPTDFRILGRTFDDAAGEAFDKSARLMGLSFPGGPNLDKLAQSGNPRAIKFPRYRPEADSLDMSFSGLKTSIRRFLESSEAQRYSQADIAASFQAAIVDVIIDRVQRAMLLAPFRMVTLTGGVAANSGLQAALRAWGQQNSVDVVIPPPKYCTDNAAMVAAAATHQGNAVLAEAASLTANPRLPFTF
jgi:N6-L-threonylcarbamoyladenine synthase